MIDSDHPSLSIARQCQLVSISRSGFYYQPSGESELNLTLMRLIDEQYFMAPGRWRGICAARATSWAASSTRG